MSSSTSHSSVRVLVDLVELQTDNVGRLDPERDDTESRRYAMLALANCCLSVDNHSTLVSQCAVEALVLGLGKAGLVDDPETHFHAAFGLCKLAQNPLMRKCIGEAGALPRLLALVRSAEIYTQVQALSALRWLFECEENRMEVLEAPQEVLEVLTAAAGAEGGPAVPLAEKIREVRMKMLKGIDLGDLGVV